MAVAVHRGTVGKTFGKGRKLKAVDYEMIRSGHKTLTRVQVGALYGISADYVKKLRQGKRGVAGGRISGLSPAKYGTGKYALRTASEQEFTKSFLEQAVPLLRTTLMALKEIDAEGVFYTKPEREPTRRRWRHVEDPDAQETGRGRQIERVALAVFQSRDANPPAVRPRDRPASGGELLLDSRRGR